MYYNCVILLDIFQFGAIYAPSADFGAFVEDQEAQDEGIRYVTVGTYRQLAPSELPHLDAGKAERWAWVSNESGLDRGKLIGLYCGLQQGLTLKNWCLKHSAVLLGIDVRRFITFGIIKGFLYRVHKYAVVDGTLAGPNGHPSRLGDHFKAACVSAAKVVNWQDGGGAGSDGESSAADIPLSRFLDGLHCFDEICTELQLSEKRVAEKMKKIYGNSVVFINR
jgi:hypothetical protein